jgi:hypothetical protein
LQDAIVHVKPEGITDEPHRLIQFVSRMRLAFDAGRLVFAGRWSGLQSAGAFRAWVKTLYRTDWVVYAKPPFGRAAQVLKYPARYTHRVAISNSRLIQFQTTQVPTL